MKQLNVTLGDSEFEALEDVKGDRTWRDAIKEEFGIYE